MYANIGKYYSISKNLISKLILLYFKNFSRESMPPNWQEFSQENLRHSNQERETSMRLRGVIGQTLSQTSQDMREQADRCEEALSRRVSESEEATRGLEDQLKQVSYKYNGSMKF